MKQSRAVQLLWLVPNCCPCSFFISRGVWIGVEGLNGTIWLDRRDWMLVILFVISGVFLAIAYCCDKSPAEAVLRCRRLTPLGGVKLRT
jgi:hypothetical protein